MTELAKSRGEMFARVPGNLLICGEYMILEEGGNGLAFACDPAATGAVWQGDSEWSVIHAVTGDGTLSLNTATEVPNPPFIVKVFRSVESTLKARGVTLPSVNLEIDTREFFRNGRKLGFGSSAAATVVMTSLLLAQAGMVPKFQRREIAEISVTAHREAQGKRGSGYDILTSCYGSAGIFTGGVEPEWEPLASGHPLYGMNIFQFPGPSEVDTRDAVSRYRDWKDHFPGQANHFFAQSQNLCRNLADQSTENRVLEGINNLREFSVELGAAIGVESWISPPSAIFERAGWKGSGAGNELGLLFLPPGRSPEIPLPYTPLKINEAGLSLFDAKGDAIL